MSQRDSADAVPLNDGATERTARIEVLPNQPNPASWCQDYIGQVFECYWFPPWGCWRIKDWGGRWDCTFSEGYQAFRILPSAAA